MKLVTRAEKVALLYINYLLERETVDQFDEWMNRTFDFEDGPRNDTRNAFYALCRDIKEMEWRKNMNDELMNDELSQEKKRQEAAMWLWNWQRGGTSISSLLFTMIAKADREWKARLRVAFPIEVEIWEEWHSTSPERAFFEKYGT